MVFFFFQPREPRAGFLFLKIFSPLFLQPRYVLLQSLSKYTIHKVQKFVTFHLSEILLFGRKIFFRLFFRFLSYLLRQDRDMRILKFSGFFFSQNCGSLIIIVVSIKLLMFSLHYKLNLSCAPDGKPQFASNFQFRSF